MKKWLTAILAVAFTVCLFLGLSACGYLGPSYYEPSGGTQSGGSGSGSSGGSSGGSNTPKEDNDGTFIYSGASVKAANPSISGDIVIPASHNGVPIDTIPASAFKGCTGITSITVPESVTSIGAGAFNGCSSLRSIALPFVGNRKGNTGRAACFGYIFGEDKYQGGTGVRQYYDENNSGVSETFYLPSVLRQVIITKETVIGRGAFQGCSMLTKIDLYNGVLQVGVGSFSGCSKIEEINLPSILIIPSSLFNGCISLSSFTINDSVETIGSYAFYGCSALASVNSDTIGEFIIPNNVTSIGEAVFNGCSMIRSITLPFVGSQKGNTGRAACFGYIFGEDKYQGGTGVRQYYDKSNSGVSETFYVPSILRSVTITNETAIGLGAFQNCSMLNEIRINSAAQNNIGANAFSNTAQPTWF